MDTPSTTNDQQAPEQTAQTPAPAISFRNPCYRTKISKPLPKLRRKKKAKKKAKKRPGFSAACG